MLSTLASFSIRSVMLLGSVKLRLKILILVLSKLLLIKLHLHLLQLLRVHVLPIKFTIRIYSIYFPVKEF